MSLPIPIEKLRIIGYTGHLPESMRPGYLAPVFKSSDGQILTAPYQIHTDCISGAAIISQRQFEEFLSDGTVHLRPSSDALPDHWLWMDVDGTVHYESKLKVEHQLKQIGERNIQNAWQYLSDGDTEKAMAAAETAFGAKATVEAHATLALCHERLGEQDLVEHMRLSAIEAGLSGGTFDVLLEWIRKNYKTAAPAFRRQSTPKRTPASEDFMIFTGLNRAA